MLYALIVRFRGVLLPFHIIMFHVDFLQTAKGAKIFSAAVAASADRQQLAKEGEEKTKLHTHSYCCLDYSQV